MEARPEKMSRILGALKVEHSESTLLNVDGSNGHPLWELKHWHLLAIGGG